MSGFLVVGGGREAARERSAQAVRADEWEMTEVSARDVVAVYRHVLTAMSPASRDLVTGALGADNRYLVALLTQQPAGLGFDSGRDNVDAAAGLLLRPLSLA